jgi:hypothetical protein
VRTQGGADWQFRHDKMRGHLAARWAAEEEVSPIDLFERTPAIWRLGRSVQQVVWEFFASRIGAERGRAVLDWAVQEAERTALQVALRRVAQRDGWPPERSKAAAGRHPTTGGRTSASATS